ncbi:MAG: pyrimidine utilization protein D [Sphingomonas bacterium]
MPHTAGLYYEEHGQADGPPLILASGLGGSAGYWKPNIAALAAQHRVIAFDQRGTGRSDRTISDTPTIEAIGEDIAALMDALDIQSAAIMGHAIGGMAGMSLALAAPERVSRLVVINGWARLDPYTARCFDIRLALLRARGPRDYVYAQPIFLYPPQWVSDHHVELEEEEDHLVAGFPDMDVVQRRILDAVRFDPFDQLGSLATPTLLVASDDDALVPPACSERMAAVMPHATLAEMKWGGHACNVTDPDIFNNLVLDFLRS